MKMYFELLVTALFSLCSSVSCNKSGSHADSAGRDAVITGFDQRLCPCCGGPMINFNNNTKPYDDRFYLITNDLSSYGISASSTFPVFVRVEYTVEKKCGDTSIYITRLVKK